MVSLLLFSVSLLSSSLSLKIQTCKELRATEEQQRVMPRVSFVEEHEQQAEALPNTAELAQLQADGWGVAPSLPWDAACYRDALPLLTEEEAAFYEVLQGALGRLHCVPMAKVHLPTLIEGAGFGDGAEADGELRDIGKIPGGGEVPFVVCHGHPLKVMAVVRLTTPVIYHPLRALAEHRIDAALAKAAIPVVHVPRAEFYDEDKLVAELLPHLA